MIICSLLKRNLVTKLLIGKTVKPLILSFRICPIGEKALKICQTQEDYLLEVLEKGAKEANLVAGANLAQMKEKVGILRRKGD